MTKFKTNSHTGHTRRWSVELTPQQIKFLCTPMKQGASRLAAYFSLLTGVVETTTSYQPLYGQAFNLEEGQTVISITDLSERWKWARETVRKFLDQLADFGLLTKEQLDRCSLITMKMNWEDAALTRGIQESNVCSLITQQLRDNISLWMNDALSTESLLEEIEDFLLTEEINGCPHMPLLSTAIQYETVRQLLHSTDSVETTVPKTMDAFSAELVSRIFNECLCGNWEEWLRFISTARRTELFHPSFYEDSGKASTPPSYDHCRDLLVSLLYHLSVFDNPGIL